MQQAGRTGASIVGLRRIALLEGLPDDRLETLAKQCAWRTWAADQSVLTREATDRDVYLIVSGKVRVTTYSALGRQVTFRDLGAGEIFGEVAAIDGRPRSADVLALESSLLASMPPGVFLQLVNEHPGAARYVVHHLAALVRKLSDRVVDLSTLGVQNRIHAEILRLAREAGVNGNAARIEPAPKHVDLASQVSTYREQVTRELSALARQGVVRRDGHALVVPDVERLARMVADLRSRA